MTPRQAFALANPLTLAEAATLPPWCGPADDAGDSGPERPRTR